jgi:hypothetical protein
VLTRGSRAPRRTASSARLATCIIRKTNQHEVMGQLRDKLGAFLVLGPFGCVHRRELPEPLDLAGNDVVFLSILALAALVEPQLRRAPVRGERHSQHGSLRELPQQRLAPAERLGDELGGAGDDDETRGAPQLAERERPAVGADHAQLEPGQALLPREPGDLGVFGLALARVEEGEQRDRGHVDAQALERVDGAGGLRGVPQRGQELRERDETAQRTAGDEREVEEHPHRAERGQDLTPYPRHGAATKQPVLPDDDCCRATNRRGAPSGKKNREAGTLPRCPKRRACLQQSSGRRRGMLGCPRRGMACEKSAAARTISWQRKRPGRRLWLGRGGSPPSRDCRLPCLPAECRPELVWSVSGCWWEDFVFYPPLVCGGNRNKEEA